MRKPTMVEVNSANLHALLSTPITCMLPLIEILKIQPELWMGVTSCLTGQGVWNENVPFKEVLRNLINTEKQTKLLNQVPVHKVGDYKAKYEGNTSLPIEMAIIVSIAILDSGARISIATKAI